MICLKRRVHLHRRRAPRIGRPVPRPRGTRSRPSRRTPCHDRLPRDRRARHDEHAFPAHRSMAISRSRAGRRRSAMARLVGPARPLQVGEPPFEHGRRSRIRAAIAGAVRRGDPGAHRHVARGPGASCPASRWRRASRAGGQSSRSPVAAAGHRLHQRRGDDERQVADRGHGRIVVAGRHADRPSAHGVARASTRPTAALIRRRDDDPRPVDQQVWALDAAKPVVSRPAIGCPPTNRRPSVSARRTIAAFRARDVGDHRVRGRARCAMGRRGDRAG